MSISNGVLFFGFSSIISTPRLIPISSSISAILLPFLVLAVPIMDITFSSLRRIMKGKSPFVADAEHIHHKLLKAGFSQKITVAILTCVAIVGGAVATYFSGVLNHYFIYIAILLAIMVLLSVISVLTKHPHSEEDNKE